MASINKVVLIGNLGADPELRSTVSGDAICNLRIATSERWKEKATGEWKESTEWHRVVLYRRLAEIAGDYLRKGASVYLEGRIRTRQWTDKDGKNRYTTEIECSEMKMLGGSSERKVGETGGNTPKSADVDPWNEPGFRSEPFDMEKIPF